MSQYIYCVSKIYGERHSSPVKHPQGIRIIYPYSEKSLLRKKYVFLNPKKKQQQHVCRQNHMTTKYKTVNMKLAL